MGLFTKTKVQEYQVNVVRPDGTTDNPIFDSLQSAETHKKDMESIGYTATIEPVAYGKGGGIKVGDFMKKKGSNLELKVLEVGNDRRSGKDYITLYNDVTNHSNTLIDWSDYELVKYAKGGEVNGKYLDTISDSKKSKILRNIANHYGISLLEAEGEVKDADAEMLYEYITNEALRMEVYNDFENKKYAKGGGVNNGYWFGVKSVKEYNQTATPIMKFYKEGDEGGEERKTGYVLSWSHEQGGSGSKYFKTMDELEKEKNKMITRAFDKGGIIAFLNHKVSPSDFFK